MLQKGHNSRRRQGFRGVVARADQLAEEAGEVDVGHPLTVELLGQQDIGDVAARLGRTPIGGELHRIRRQFHDGVPVGFVGRDVRILPGEHLLGDAVHVRPVLLGKAHQPAHDAGRQLGAHVVHELDVRTGLARFGHDVAAQLADLLLELADRARLEARDHRLAVVRVARRVHRDQHVARHREAFRRRVLQHDAALGGREQVRLMRDRKHVGMRQYGVEAGLAVHVLPHHRLRAAQLGEQLVRRTVRERVRVSEPQRGGRHQAGSHRTRFT